jgi:hypothetical protein
MTNGAAENCCDCAACAGVTQSTPVIIDNSPGLPHISARIGVYSSFLASMLAGLSDSNRPALAPLTARTPEDYSIAVLDAFAMVGDILTFYQERFAQENYLRTATELRSVLQLARLIGYELNPGVAASVALAFTLDPTAGSPASLDLPAGTRAQSTPGPGETAQVFETIGDISGFQSLSALYPRTTKPAIPGHGTSTVWLQGASLNLKTGDPLVFVSAERLNNPLAGKWDFRRIQSATSNAQANVTQVILQESIGVHLGTAPAVFALRKQASLFGYNATPWAALPVAWRIGELDPNTWSVIDGVYKNCQGNWNDAPFLSSRTQIWLDVVYSQISVGSWIILAAPGGGATPTVELYQVTSVVDTNAARFAMTGRVTKVGIAGYRIDKFSPLTASVYGQSEQQTLAARPMPEPLHPASEQLAAYAPNLVKGRAIIVSGPRARVTVAKGANLTLTATPPPATQPPPTRMLVAGEQLYVVAVGAEAANGQRTFALKTIDGFAGDVAATVTGDVLVTDKDLIWTSALKSDPIVAEATTVGDFKPSADVPATIIDFNPALANIYDRALATIYANVAPATTGQTVSEALGSGDGSTPFLSFQLKQPPLTFVPASTPTGGQSTLQVTVGNAPWTLVDTLYGEGANARVYASRNDENANTTVLFGDGALFGARAPSGTGNIQATYRSGLGSAGNVDSGQINILLSRPLGLKAVTNPIPASGGADPQPADQARVLAPLSVSTLARAVSILDYQNFALCFSGVAKALATWSWDGSQRCVILTLAGTDGALVDKGSKLATDLMGALQNFGDPTVPVSIQSFVPVFFEIGIDVLASDPNALGATQAAVEAALRFAFGFDSRSLGQWVTLSGVLEIAQNVSGVVAVEITQLYRSDQPSGLNPILAAATATSGGQSPTSAELLTLDPAPFAHLGAMN